MIARESQAQCSEICDKSNNTGLNAFGFLTTGAYNTAIGYDAMVAATSATANVAVGDHALAR
jgi:hypothetical protein